uniref:Putative secreted peptide n=1 Tax=Anopheles braziliensis TaxID=58242 RepID=A0A2M3ZXW5_9DIPT
MLMQMVVVMVLVGHIVGINLTSGAQVTVRTLCTGARWWTTANGTRSSNHVVRWLCLSSQMMTQVMVMATNRWIGRSS